MSAIEIRSASVENLETIRDLLHQSRFKPLRCLQNRLEANLDDAWLSSLAESLQAGNSQALLAMHDHECRGLLVYAENQWETKVIGAKAGHINHFVVAPNAIQTQVATQLVSAAAEQASSSGFGLLLGRSYSDDYTVIHALQSAGFLLMDTVVDCFFDFLRSPLRDAPIASPDCILRHAHPGDRPELVSLARSAFQGHFGRFHADERLGRDVATRVYEQWLTSSLEGYADWINVAEISGRIAGFSVWKKPTARDIDLNVRVGHYSISGIHPNYHGRGLFTALTRAGMLEMRAFADIVEGPTHINNYGVHAGYSKLGWRVGADARHSFHKWLD